MYKYSLEKKKRTNTRKRKRKQSHGIFPLHSLISFRIYELGHSNGIDLHKLVSSKVGAYTIFLSLTTQQLYELRTSTITLILNLLFFSFFFLDTTSICYHGDDKINNSSNIDRPNIEN